MNILFGNHEDHSFYNTLWIHQICDQVYDQAILDASLAIIGKTEIDFVEPSVSPG